MILSIKTLNILSIFTSYSNKPSNTYRLIVLVYILLIFFHFPYGRATPVNQFLDELNQNLTVIVFNIIINIKYSAITLSWATIRPKLSRLKLKMDSTLTWPNWSIIFPTLMMKHNIFSWGWWSINVQTVHG